MIQKSLHSIIQERYENGMFKVKPLLPVFKQGIPDKPELPKPVFVNIEPQELNTKEEIKPEVIEAHEDNIIEVHDVVVTETKLEVFETKTEPISERQDDQAFEAKSDSNIDDVDLTKLEMSVGAHKSNNLKLSWVENRNKNKDDFRSIEWGKEPNASFVVGRVQFPVPMFWDAEGHKMHLEDHARGLPVILSGGGSYDNHNNITVNSNDRSNIKIMTKLADISLKTLKSPAIKLMPLEFARSTRSDGVYNFHNPFACYYMRNNKYQRNDFWYEDSFFSDDATGFNDLITSIRILFVMGYRTIYLDGFKSGSNDFAIFDDVIKNSVGKIKIFNIGSSDMRNVPKFDKARALSECIL